MLLLYYDNFKIMIIQWLRSLYQNTSPQETQDTNIKTKMV